ncbi:endonuclease domain-containing protein [Aliidiomarina quisquiliarum]|uniref:endonuclease domain-containing protein n=1 Tax=Aliidiomarina quisquiliarum TaxID=2938947 RepID=UPI00208E2F59|nr:DUF559 domain-containing protein [Aliidiomarina quisquiliarum]MCO4320354.1 endonuclease domain-containing protein [Aliidiomarina quisquiliarum]
MAIRIVDSKTLEQLIAKGRIKEADAGALRKAIKSSSKRRTVPLEDTLCTLPPSLPVVRLYRAVVARYGRFDESGEVVCEMNAPFTGRKWALDMALPRYRLGIEMDGWEFHGKYKEGFQRDREKQTDFARFGWLLLRVSNKQINDDLDDVVTALTQCVAHLPRFDNIHLKERGIGRYECTKNPT